MKDSPNCCEHIGAAKPKSGDNVTALSRTAGMSKTMRAVEAKTRSRHHSGGTAYHYTGVSGYGSNENIKGYGS